MVKHIIIWNLKDELTAEEKNDDGDFDKDEIADVISAVLMDVLKSLDD